MIRATSKGDDHHLRDFINRVRNHAIYSDLDHYGQMGVDALAAVTPQRTGLAARAWRYRIVKTSKHIGIEWYSSDQIRGTPVVILLQYGHATGTGGYVRGRDFINPAMKPIFDQIADNVWTKVVKS